MQVYQLIYQMLQLSPSSYRAQQFLHQMLPDPIASYHELYKFLPVVTGAYQLLLHQFAYQPLDQILPGPRAIATIGLPAPTQNPTIS